MIPPGGIFDAHVDTLLKAVSAEGVRSGCAGCQLDLRRASAAGVTTLVTAICAEAAPDPRAALEKGLSFWRELRPDSPVKLLLGLEGCEPVASGWIDEATLSLFSVASLTWNGMNSLGGGTGSPEGLTPAGEALARRLTRSGILVDVSHLSDSSRAGILGTGIPAVATHCNCRALCDVPRNLPDEDIREIAALGGVVGLTFVPDFLGPGADLDTVADHVLHAVEIAGVESVGFGSDFDGVAALPAGMDGCGSWPALFDRLESRGMRGVDLNRIAGSNWRRVFNMMRGQS